MLKKLLAVAGTAALSLTITTLPAHAAEGHGSGFDQYGYNDTARVFSGNADGVDRNLDGTVWGDPTYANDHVVMKWSKAWDQGNAEGWTGSYPDAWTTNEYNGRVPGGSGEVWHYKIKWVGSDLESSPYWVDGGYPIWGQFEVVMDQGTTPEGHAVYAHGTSNGLG